jgi:hypothetical protein
MASVAKWTTHFSDMAKGKVHSDMHGFYRVGVSQLGGGGGREPRVKLVTPTAQAVEQAKAEIKEVKSDLGPPGRKRKRGPSKKGKAKSLKRLVGGRATKSSSGKKRSAKTSDALS